MKNYPIERFQHLDTPFYFYDLSLLQQTLNSVKENLKLYPHFHVHYAIKANSNSRLLSFISKDGFGADCVSGGEVIAAHENGFAAEKIVFAGVGKSDKEIRQALSIGIYCFNVESLQELEVINELAASMNKVAHIAFRVNPNVDAQTHEKITTGLNENKFGIALDDVVTSIRRCQVMNHVEYAGLHFHIGSQIVNMQVYVELCHTINRLQDLLDSLGITTGFINVGGGLGIDYDNPEAHPIPDFKAYFSTFAEHLNLRQGQQVHFELGRSIVAQCGYLVSRTLFVKEGRTKKFIIVDAGFTDLIRPAMYGAHHCIENISSQDAADRQLYDVVGPICESSDVFAQDELMPETQRGDLIVFRSAGAYGEVMASTYNCRTLPKAYFVD